jgi:hypothetical protein
MGDDVLAKVIADDLTTTDAAIDDIVDTSEEE